jgi:pyrimidine operon attenuation protein/uracil phosphoribosyltransferase
MAAPRPRLVVRNHAPGRRALLIGSAVLLGLIAMWSVFEWGRSRAGFDGTAARRERSELNDRISELEDELRGARLKLAMYDSDSAGQIRERNELSRTIGDLQAQVAKLTSDVAFYRGIVEERTGGDVVKVQQFQVNAGGTEREFLLRLVLGRPLGSEVLVSGKVRVTIDGTSEDGAPASFDLAQLTDVASGELSFKLRYVETLEQAVTLPEGFMPARSTVQLLPSRKGAKEVRETFLWTVEN